MTGLTCECNHNPENPEQVEHCPQHGNVRLFAELLEGAKDDLDTKDTRIEQLETALREIDSGFVLPSQHKIIEGALGGTP